MIDFWEPWPSDIGQSHVKRTYSKIVMRQKGCVVPYGKDVWKSQIHGVNLVLLLFVTGLRHLLWFSLVSISCRVGAQCMIRDLTIEKHIVSRLTKVYNRRAFCPAEIFVCFYLPLRGSHHQCVKMMKFLRTKVICSGCSINLFSVSETPCTLDTYKVHWWTKAWLLPYGVGSCVPRVHWNVF